MKDRQVTRRAAGINVPVSAMISRMTATKSAGRPSRYGPRHAVNVRFPLPVYEKICASAAAAGMSLVEYVIVRMAELEGVELPSPQSEFDQDALPIGA